MKRLKKEPRVVVQSMIDPELLAEVKKLAKKNKVSVSRVVEYAIEELVRSSFLISAYRNSHK